MALPTQSHFCFAISPAHGSNLHRQISRPPPPRRELRIPISSSTSSTAARRRRHPRPLQSSPSSPEGIPTELSEDSKFVPLNAEDPVFGPPVLLLIGFEVDETDKIQNLLKELDGEFLKVIHCTEEMTRQTVWDAMHSEQPNLGAVKIAPSLPRICFLSGLSGEEMIMFIDAFPERGR